MLAQRCFLVSLGLQILLLAALGCTKNGSKTTMAGSWRDPQLGDAAFERLFVIGAGRNEDYRRLYEDSLVAALERQGVHAVPSYDVLPQSEELTERQIREAIGAEDFDAVVITSLLHVDRTVEVVPPRTEQVPIGQAPYSFAGFYHWAYETVHIPGYHKLHTRYNIEARLYRVDDGELVWWGLSETLNPDSVEEIIASVSSAMAKRLQGDGLVR